MPTPSISQIPKTKSEKEFENMCTDVLEKIYNKRFTQYGRQGQKQNGIDIYSDDKTIVAQCKNYLKTTTSNIFIKKINEDIKDMKNLEFYKKINKFIIMTAMDKDTLVQNTDFDTNIRIQLWFWEDIQEEICNDQKLLRKYYSSFYGDNNKQINKDITNEVIATIKYLNRAIEYFVENNINFSINYGDDNRNLYNSCVVMFNSISKIQEIKNENYIEIEELDVLIEIETILNKHIPAIYDATYDETGANLIATLSNYDQYFNNHSNYNGLTKACKKIIRKLGK